MFMVVFSIVLVVASNVAYNVAQKSTPAGVAPFATLLVTYLIATAVTGAALLLSRPDGGVAQAFKGLSWTSLLLGFAIVGLEVGFLLAYRAGWDISVGALVANIALALVLIPVGVAFYGESFGSAKVAGAAFCLVGLVLINLR